MNYGGYYLSSVTTRITEEAWNGSNGGYSKAFTRPSYQNGFQINGQRGVPDLAANADPNTGYYICYSSLYYSFSCIQVGGM